MRFNEKLYVEMGFQPLRIFLIFSYFEPGYSYKRYSYKKNDVATYTTTSHKHLTTQQALAFLHLHKHFSISYRITDVN